MQFGEDLAGWASAAGGDVVEAGSEGFLVEGVGGGPLFDELGDRKAAALSVGGDASFGFGLEFEVEPGWASVWVF